MEDASVEGNGRANSHRMHHVHEQGGDAADAARDASSATSSLTCQNLKDYCSDITNTLVGISGETGTVARISMFIVCTVLPPVKRGAGLSQLIIF